MADELPVLPFVSVAAWERWLAKHYESSQGVWVKFAKKDSGIKSLTYAEAVEGALCYGWIDGQAQSIDETWYLQRYTPRRPRSKWSKINCGKVEKLIGQGRMKPAGLRQIDAAKKDGRWEAAYDSPRTSTVPDDLTKALAKNAPARRFFETLSGRNRFAVLYRIQNTKKPETRARQIEKFVKMLAEGKTVYP